MDKDQRVYGFIEQYHVIGMTLLVLLGGIVVSVNASFGKIPAIVAGIAGAFVLGIFEMLRKSRSIAPREEDPVQITGYELDEIISRVRSKRQQPS